MANVNNNNVSVNFGFTGKVQSGAAVVVCSRQNKMRHLPGKPLTQPHFLRYSMPSSHVDSESTEETEWAAAGAICWPHATAMRTWEDRHEFATTPEIWASLVISRAISI